MAQHRLAVRSTRRAAKARLTHSTRPLYGLGGRAVYPPVRTRDADLWRVLKPLHDAHWSTCPGGWVFDHWGFWEAAKAAIPTIRYKRMGTYTVDGISHCEELRVSR